MSLLSVIIPSYNEEANIERTAGVLGEVLSEAQIEYELLFVSDGSKDKTYELVCNLSKQDDRIKGLQFSRNFGKEATIFAGLSLAKGDCCAVIDCDLQHPPRTLVEMYRLWQTGIQVVEGVKTSRGKESVLHAAAAKAFYTIELAVALALGIIAVTTLNRVLNVIIKKLRRQTNVSHFHHNI